MTALLTDVLCSEERPLSDEPPKVELIEQKEEGAIFSVKCSLHLLKENNTWAKMGVGFANIKELDETEEKGGEKKRQLLVRAATTLGTIWVNTVVNKQMKAFKMNDKQIKVGVLVVLLLSLGLAGCCLKFSTADDVLNGSVRLIDNC